ncbi:MAG TPA: hypothetical protein VHY22_19195 [Chthoniobacteraceae bacterium]|jgi:hypothetical protein|nr:hypothetical protein [Chthoniobacteraceae bacterium]
MKNRVNRFYGPERPDGLQWFWIGHHSTYDRLLNTRQPSAVRSPFVEFVGPALREAILPEDEYKIRVNGEFAWDDLGFREYSQDTLRFCGSLDDKMFQSQFYVFLAIGKLLFGQMEISQAMDIASGMVGARSSIPVEPAKPLELDFDF